LPGRLLDPRRAIRKESISEVVYNDGSITLVHLADGVEIILGKRTRRHGSKGRSGAEDAKRRG
jgi:hypothetical protein